MWHVAPDLTGQRFGMLVVLERTSNSRTGHSRWLCQCDCGNKHIVFASSLKSKGMHSCGCLRKTVPKKVNTTHGHSKTRIYNVWSSMKGRCNNPDNKQYKNYGGRGLNVCEEWENFEPFYKWAIANGYNSKLQIDRKDNNKGYSPDNCHWTTCKENNNNRRSNLNITYNGETKTLQQWSEALKIDHRTLRTRLITYGWSVEKSFTTPVKKKKVKKHAISTH